MWESPEAKLQEMDKESVLDHRTCGFLFKTTDSYVAVCLSYSEEYDTICEVQQIPRGCIQKIAILEDGREE